ncbi:hypothetical protein VCHA53O466_40343 [Vibrio chagasii]|nr:hypothetical protein VCHA53O466_40343 [Vibrio chagasii]
MNKPIYSYETLFEKWLTEKKVSNIVTLGKNLKHDKEGFLYDDPCLLLELAAEVKSPLMFYSILYCYEPSELEAVNLNIKDEDLTHMFNLYKESRLDSVDYELSKVLFPSRKMHLPFY